MKNIKYPLILDGGLSNVLEGYGCDLHHELWSAKLIHGEPELIMQAHLEYLKAGAKCITSSGYQASFTGFINASFTRTEAKNLILKTIEIAENARSIYLKDNPSSQSIYIAASMGPYGAILADGSEYHGNYDISEAEIKEFHAERIQLLSKTNADFFAFETIPSLLEVSALAQLSSSFNKPTWISFSCKDEVHLNDGNKISEAATLLANSSNVFAIGVNCTSPKYISQIIEILKREATDKKIIVYPNSGEVFHAKSKSWLGVSDPFSFEKMAEEWYEKGADIIGGCCRIGPDHIKRIKGLSKSNY